VFDAKKAIRRGWDLYGAPMEALRDEDEVTLIEEQQAQIQKLQMYLQMLMQGAMIDKTGQEAERARQAR